MGWTITPHSAVAAEGHAGTTTYTFEVAFTGTPQGDPAAPKVGAVLRLSDVTTEADDAIQFAGGGFERTVELNVGPTMSTLVSVTTTGDTAVETHEIFAVEIVQELTFYADGTPNGALSPVGPQKTAYGLVVNDDGPAAGGTGPDAWISAVRGALRERAIDKAEAFEIGKQVVREEIEKAAEDGLTREEVDGLKDTFGGLGLDRFLDRELAKAGKDAVKDAAADGLDGDEVNDIRDAFDDAGRRVERQVDRALDKAIRKDAKESVEDAKDEDGALDADEVDALAARFEDMDAANALKRPLRKEAKDDLDDIDPDAPDASDALQDVFDIYVGHGFDGFLEREAGKVLEAIEEATEPGELPTDRPGLENDGEGEGGGREILQPEEVSDKPDEEEGSTPDNQLVERDPRELDLGDDGGNETPDPDGLGGPDDGPPLPFARAELVAFAEFVGGLLSPDPDGLGGPDDGPPLPFAPAELAAFAELLDTFYTPIPGDPDEPSPPPFDEAVLVEVGELLSEHLTPDPDGLGGPDDGPPLPFGEMLIEVGELLSEHLTPDPDGLGGPDDGPPLPFGAMLVEIGELLSAGIVQPMFSPEAEDGDPAGVVLPMLFPGAAVPETGDEDPALQGGVLPDGYDLPFGQPEEEQEPVIEAGLPIETDPFSIVDIGMDPVAPFL